MRLDDTGIKFLKDREGLRLSAYLDVAGVATIGYGTTVFPNGRKVKLGDTCTKEQAEMYKAHDLVGFERCVNSFIIISGIKSDKQIIYPELTQNQYNALVALCYNIGTGDANNGFIGSTVRRTVNSVHRNDVEAITHAFLMWNKITVIRNGVKEKEVSPGLVNRRKKEIHLYFS